jgi:L-fuconolactonase
VVAKLSGLYASVGALEGWTIDQLRPFVDDAVEILGPERLMYGGDWPISVLAGGYERCWQALSGLVHELGPTAAERILGGTALDVYRIHPDLIAAAVAVEPEGEPS